MENPGNFEDFRTRQANDRAAALDAKYDPDDDIAARRFGVPIEASAFLKNFMKKGKSMGGSESAMGGEV
tara:strand:+ start:66 stop:272 length:207 start_codon:yes stop_codon:yes gene_type:complete